MRPANRNASGGIKGYIFKGVHLKAAYSRIYNVDLNVGLTAVEDERDYHIPAAWANSGPSAAFTKCKSDTEPLLQGSLSIQTVNPHFFFSFSCSSS